MATVISRGVMVRYFGMEMPVGCWTVVMLRMIMSGVLVHMERRRAGGRKDQGLHERESDQPAHDDQSTMAALT